MAPAYRITYFDIPALGEPARWLFTYGGIDFEDRRLTFEEWPALKGQTPFGQVPILEHNGKTVSQSVAIARYAGKLVGLAGKDDWEDLEIDSVVDTMNELELKVRPYAVETNEEKKQKLKEDLLKETIPFYCSRLDERIKNNGGYFVGGHLTWADVYATSLSFLFRELLEGYANLKKLREAIIENKNIKEYLVKHPIP